MTIKYQFAGILVQLETDHNIPEASRGMEHTLPPVLRTNHALQLLTSCFQPPEL